MRIILLFTSFILLNACARKAIEQPEYTFEEDILLEHDLRTNQYEFFFRAGNQERSIYRGENPAAIDWKSPLLVTSDESIKVAGLTAKDRTYFGIQSGADSFIVSERRIALEGASNFRDLGGIQTATGRRVKWGKIYRSNRLSSLTKRDLKTLKSLNLKVVADFRYSVEFEKHPDRIPKGAEYHQYPIGLDGGTRYLAIRKQVIQGATADEVTDMFIGIMEEFSDTATVFFKPIVDHLLAEEVPLVFHCSSGKDRTGYMAAIILSALGVDRATIMKEYLMSNFYRYEENLSTYRKGRLIGLDREMLATGFLVKEVYLNKVWEIIDTKYGGIDSYLEQQFGLTPDKREQLIEMYTY